MKQEYRYTQTTVSLINYHFVFCPRYRRKVLVKDVEQRFKDVLNEICEENDFHIVALEVMPDHVHIFLNALPSISPSDIMAKVKGVTSRRLRQELLLNMSIQNTQARHAPYAVNEIRLTIENTSVVAVLKDTAT